MQKIQRVSHYFRILFQLIFIGIPIVQIIGWSYAPHDFMFGVVAFNPIPEGYRSHIMVSTFGMETKISGFLLDMIPTSFNLLVLYFLTRLFKLYEVGEIFSLDNVGYLRKIGYALVVGQILHPFYEGLMGVVVTWPNPAGSHQRFAMVSFGTTNLGVLIMAGLVILVSWIMAEGYKLREEQQLTV